MTCRYNKTFQYNLSDSRKELKQQQILYKIYSKKQKHKVVDIYLSESGYKNTSKTLGIQQTKVRANGWGGKKACSGDEPSQKGIVNLNYSKSI